MSDLIETSYELSACDTGIVHIGFGAFHRAHQSVFIDDYMEATGDLAWGIAAVNLRASEAEAFASARSGYLLKTIDPSGAIAWRRVRSHREFFDWSQEQASAVALLSRSSVRAITITVTESGYALSADWTLNPDDPFISAELKGEKKTTVYAYLTDALLMRVESGAAPISIICCDNIRRNGAVLQNAFFRYLDLMGHHSLIAWCKDNVTFPNTMVDRITPKAPPELVSEQRQKFPEEAGDPIHSEAFTQWIIEDQFATVFPDLNCSGAEIVENVDPYEEAKIRILNGGHVGLAYFGALAGHTTFDQAMNDPAIRPYFDGWEEKDVLPGLDISLPFDKHAYFLSIVDRFKNSAIADQITRICMDGWFKMPIYVRPTLRARLEQGQSPEFGYDVVASWYLFARRYAEDPTAISYVEPYWDLLSPLLEKGQEHAFARNQQLWSDLPEVHPAFVSGIVNSINKLERELAVSQKNTNDSSNAASPRV